jgi:hypothetical protein
MAAVCLPQGGWYGRTKGLTLRGLDSNTATHSHPTDTPRWTQGNQPRGVPDAPKKYSNMPPIGGDTPRGSLTKSELKSRALQALAVRIAIPPYTRWFQRLVGLSRGIF